MQSGIIKKATSEHMCFNIMVFRLMIKKLFKFEWQVIEIILDPQHRKRKYSLRDRTP